MELNALVAQSPIAADERFDFDFDWIGFSPPHARALVAIFFIDGEKMNAIPGTELAVIA